MKAAHRQTPERIFTNPVSGSIRWRDVEALLVALGADVSEGSGSRVRFTISGQTLFLHRPHPSPDTRRWAIRDIREFLTNVGLAP
ncbi:type II toxin-antitoxin system HicA family toxin [Mesorhizobium sp. WSM4303]|uniref:type II toxin-antitoxin system HicA family toxin n=1 Tax=unclassified Mesorhizobium TaxID=325217 RepID=UPI00115D2E2B|nr:MULTISPECIES: type II toxin-antitoxin system HicA family toxin [unclassified Mesorhizobium]TRC97399.1 type II toxin-antitoxin system HicA family toxin [Mesorhizobium sp. WSM4306]TRD08904.1 type II toxin-antitoxin system HicA family toxin [Mesorhizobium sp. WSM4303]